MELWDEIIIGILTNIIAAVFITIFSFLTFRALYILYYWIKFYWIYIIRREEIQVELSIGREYEDASVGRFEMKIFLILKKEFSDYALREPIISPDFLIFQCNLIPNRIITRIYTSDDEMITDLGFNSEFLDTLLLRKKDENEVKEVVSVTIYPENELFTYISNNKIKNIISLFSRSLGYIEKEIITSSSDSHRSFRIKVYSDFTDMRKKYPDPFKDEQRKVLVKYGKNYLQISTFKEENLIETFFEYFKRGKIKKFVPNR